MAKDLHEEHVIAVKKAIASGEYPNLSAVARALGLDRTLVSKIASGDRWAHVELEGDRGTVGFQTQLNGNGPRVQRGHRTLTDDQARYARRHLHHKTRTMKQLADELGVHIDVIRGIKVGRTYRDVQAYAGVEITGHVGTTREKLTPEQKEEILDRLADGETQRAVADSMGIPLPTLSYFYVNHRRRTGEGGVRSCQRITADVKQRVRELSYTGMSQRAIGERVGLRQQTVSRILAAA